MRKSLIIFLSLSAFGLSTLTAATAGAKYKGKNIVSKKEVEAKVKEFNDDSLPKKELFNHLLVTMAQERAIDKEIADSKLESDPEFKRVAKLNAQDFKRFYYIQKEAKKLITQSMRQAIYDQLKASQVGKKEFKPRIIRTLDQKIASDVYERLKKGEKFEALVKIYSVDQETKDKGGLLNRFLPEEALGPEAGTLKEGVPSKPIKTSNGYVIFLIDKGNIRDYKMPPIDSPELAGQIEQIATTEVRGLIQTNFFRQIDAYDLDGKRIPLVPEQEENHQGIPLINGGVKK